MAPKGAFYLSRAGCCALALLAGRRKNSDYRKTSDSSRLQIAFKVLSSRVPVALKGPGFSRAAKAAKSAAASQLAKEQCLYQGTALAVP
jgi:hypothetical protein